MTLSQDRFIDRSAVYSIVVLYALLLILPAMAKGITKEVFKLIYRSRRKFFRLKDDGKDTSGFSFKWAFLAEVSIFVVVTGVQLPLFIVWWQESCAFLQQFMQFWYVKKVNQSKNPSTWPV